MAKSTNSGKMKRETLVDWCNHEGAFGEQLLSEWTGIDEDGNTVLLDTVTKGSHRRMKWYCKNCNKPWVVDIHNRTGYRTGCPNCSNNDRSRRTIEATTRVGENDLLTWCNNHGEYGQFLLSEWLGQREDGEYVDIHQVARGSSKPVLWRCSFCTEIFPCKPYSRTGKNKQGCPNCNTRSTSYPEQYIFFSLKTVFPNAISRGKLLGYEYDIILPSVSTYIEYSPTFTHNGKQARDDKKALICKENGLRFIRIIEDSYNKLAHYATDSEICFVLDYSNKQKSLQVLMGSLFEQLHVHPDSIDYEEVDELAYLRSHKRIEFTDSVEYIYPEIVKEWHETLNGQRKPSQLTPYASEVIFWKCTRCGYGERGEWKALLSNRTHLKQGCPACGYNWYDGEVHSTAQPITLIGKTDFPSCFPELYKEWNTEKNGAQDPFRLRCNSHKPVYWICQKCGYGVADDWKTPVYSRINSKTGCPACGYNCFDKQYHITSGTTAVVEGKTDLKALYPKLCEEWDREKNKPYLPERTKPKSRRKMFWVCQSCGYGSNGEWRACVGDRVVDQSGCPRCGFNCFTGKHRKNASKLVTDGVNDIASSPHKNILLEWHPKLNTLSPSEARVSSHDWVYWECTKCHYGKNGEWYNTLNSRTNQKSGCPVCGFNYYDGKYHKTTGRAVVLPGINDLTKTHPLIAKEWHPSLNGELTPLQVKAGQHIDVFWQCPQCGFGKDGEWKQDLHVRTRQKPLCKKCRRAKPGKE